MIATDGIGVIVKQANPFEVDVTPELSKCPGLLEVRL